MDKLSDIIIRKLEAGGSLDQLPALAERLRQEAGRRLVVSRVISAVELGEDQKQKLRDSLDTTEIEFVLDPSILGGLIIEHEGKRTDLSWVKRING